MQLRDGVDVDASPANVQFIEQLDLLVALPKGVPHVRLLYFLELEPNVLQELTEIAHCGAPLRRESLTLLAQDGKTPLERRADAQAMQIENARGEPSADAFRAAVDNDGLTRPDRSIAEAKLEGLQQAARDERYAGRRCHPEPRGAQVEDADRADEDAVASEIADKISGDVGDVEARRPESNARPVRADQIFVSRGARV
jgi:hypothetical protein